MVGKVFGEENIDKINIRFIRAGIRGVWGERGRQSPPRGAFLELSCGARAARGQRGHPGAAASAGLDLEVRERTHSQREEKSRFI